MARIGVRRAARTAADLAVLIAALWLAFEIRFDFDVPAGMRDQFLIALPYVVLVQYAALTAMAVQRSSWQHVSLREAKRISAAMLAAGTLLVAIRLAVGGGTAPRTLGRAGAIPLGVLLIGTLLALVGLLAVRVARRWHVEARNRRHHGVAFQPRRTLLVGAGQAGALVAREVLSRPDLGILPVAFADDDPRTHNNDIHGIRVLGGVDDLPELAGRTAATEALVTIASLSAAQLRRITRLCDEAGLGTRIIPGVFEIIGGNLNLSRIRPVDIEDLLGREPVELDTSAISSFLRDATVMVTGAGGSIGAELCRQIARFEPDRLVLVERSENNLFAIVTDLEERGVAATVVAAVADACDGSRMGELFARHRPAVVFHAAAHKHVPIMEANPCEAVKNNVVGTRVVADLAHAHGTGTFVLVSTDKAVNPTSVMGATKRVAELYVQALATASATRFVTVRFGNVLGSDGSVVPLFRRQIARGGPVTVTHPEMRRYFMTIPEAAQLVLQAGALGRGGEVFLLDMGEPVLIVDLAREMIALSGLEPDQDIEIRFIGVRPGEKLSEDLALATEQADRTEHPKIFVGHVESRPRREVEADIDRLARFATTNQAGALRAALAAVVPQFGSENGTPRPQPTQTPPP